MSRRRAMPATQGWPRSCWSPLLCLLVLPGRVTADLWGHRYRLRGSGADRWMSFEPKRSTESQWWRVALRVVATPATVALDVVTLPVQFAAVGGLEGHR